MVRDAHLTGSILRANSLRQVFVDCVEIGFLLLDGLRRLGFTGLRRRVLLLAPRPAGNGGDDHGEGHQTHLEVSHIVDRF